MKRRGSMFVFFNGDIIEHKKVNVSPFDRGFQFSDGVYEVIRYYPQNFFQLQMHIDRLKNSLIGIEIPPPSFDNLESTLYTLIEKNNLTDELSIAYIQITRGCQYPRRHNFTNESEPTFFILVEKYPAKFNEMFNGVKVGIEEDIRWHRCNIKSTMLTANILSNHRAISKGFIENILHRSGIITEGTHTNICFVKNNTLHTPPLSNFILPGITRKIILDLCSQFDIKYFERDINLSELPDFDEAFLLGTTTEITPIIEMEGINTSFHKPGPICKLLQREYKKLYYGQK